MRNDSILLDVYDVSSILDIGKSKAYKIIHQLNEELKAQGYITIAGRINEKYFNERIYGGLNDRNDH